MSSAIGSSWKEVRKDIFTPEEIAECDLRVALMRALFEARENKGLSHGELVIISGVKRRWIARMERGDIDVQLDVVLKLLAALGKTLAIVSLEDQ